MILACVRTGRIFIEGEEPVGDDAKDLMLMPIQEAEPYYEQSSRSASSPLERTSDGKFDKSHLSPERAYRINRDYLAHCLRYSWPMKVIRERVGVGARILEMGCGEEIPFFRALTCDPSAVMHYKPDLFVAADLNKIKYRPAVTGCRTVILEKTNIIDDVSKVPDEPFDLVISFEVLEHMDKPDGERFLDAMVEFARRKPVREGKPSLILLSTPVNDGFIAKNHKYEFLESELERAWLKRGCIVKAKYGTFANLPKLVAVLTPEERIVWNRMATYHGPNTLSCFFAATHPEIARNIAWMVEVSV